MNPQGGAVNLQGGNGTISVQGSNYNPQPANPGIPIQGSNVNPSTIGAANSTINQGNAAVNSASSAVAAGNAQSQQIANLLKSIQAEEQANAPGTPISLDINKLNAQAQSAAGNSVNPLYSSYLNQYLQEEAANKQAAQVQNQLNLQSAQTGLGKTLSANKLQAQQTAQQNSLQQGNINVQQKNYELQSGNAQAAKMQAISGAIGSGNLGASGIGQQQLYEAENARNIADAAQRGSFQYQRDTSNLSANDTFAQLGQSSQYAQTQEGQAETQLNFNLNDYLRQASYNDSQYQQGLEAQRQQAVTAATQNNLAQGVQGAITGSGVSGKNLVATNQAYSPYLTTTAMPSVSELASLGSQFSTGNYGSNV